jgi:hypothetical protein
MPHAPRRRHLKSLAAAGLLGAGGIAGLIREVLAAGVKPVPPGLYRVKGDVRINGQPAREGTPVKPGDSVTTGRGAEAVFVIGQDAFLQRENSVVNFGQDAAKEFFRVLSGKLLSVFGKGEKRLATPTATIGIRGTGCYIEATEKTVYFCLCYGIADVTPTAEPSRTDRIETRHHDHPILIHNDQGMPAMADAKVINHTDAELTLLENLTGRWPPFSGSATAY